MGKWCVGLASLATVTVAMAACDPGSAAPSTTGASVSTSVAIAAPTTPVTVATTAITTLAPTTQAPTTAAPVTTTAPTPAETAEAEIRATLQALDTDFDACFAAPDSCEIDALLDTYMAADDDDVRPIYRDVWSDLKADNEVKIWNGRIERTVVRVSAEVDGNTGTSYHCELDDTINVPKSEPSTASTADQPPHQTGYIRYYYEWQRRSDNSWVITHSEMGVGIEPDVIAYGAMPSLAESEIAECF